jgi:FkbM family methyltransferase
MTRAIPFALRVGALIRAPLPSIRIPGRETVLEKLLSLDSCYPDAVVEGSLGEGVRFIGNFAVERNYAELALFRYARPSLWPILDAVLEPGQVFADVGTHLGVYSLLAASRVGSEGQVFSFEPVTATAARIEENAALNGFDQIEVINSAVGSECGTVVLSQVDGATGVTSRYTLDMRKALPSQQIEVPMTTLDAFFESRPAPNLMKVDVEGMEAEVFFGAEKLLSQPEGGPVVVFEAIGDYFAKAGISYAEALRFLERTGGYSAWALRTTGLAREPEDPSAPGSLNILLLREQDERHARALQRLRRYRFDKNQNL